ncbi:MAG: alpha/beta hydrolase [Trueperaceae bacterium]|nr:MAG: alpha/beta hydrolase [Trueperaceae bacterium]
MPFRIKVSLAILLAMAVLVALGPFLIPIPPLTDTVDEQELADDDSQFIDIGDLNVHVKSSSLPLEGTSAFVLLHGSGTGIYTWHQVLEPLGTITKAVAFDRPGFGLTERPLPGEWQGTNPYGPEAQVTLTIELMDQLGIVEAILVGHSTGGAIALKAALEHPERVAGLILVGATAYRTGSTPAWTRLLLSTPQVNRLGPLIMRQYAGPSGENLLRAAWSKPELLDRETLDAYRKAFRIDNWDRALWELSKASREPRLTKYLSEITQPVLVIAGAEDRIVPPELSERLGRDLPNATVAIFEGCGHVAQEECPDPFLEVVQSWLFEESGLF